LVVVFFGWFEKKSSLRGELLLKELFGVRGLLVLAVV
jgi:hypothetical protein